MNLAQIGYGYWGRNLMRVFSSVEGAQLVACCEPQATATAELQKKYPAVELYDKLETILAQPQIDAVIIATPAGIHYPQTKQVLKAGKHCFVEKPLARTATEARELVALGIVWRA